MPLYFKTSPNFECNFNGFALFYCITYILFYVNIAHCFQEDSFLDGQLTLTVEDTLEDPNMLSFSPRSLIHIRSVKSGTAVVSHTRELSDAAASHLKTLVDKDELYRIRIQQKGAEDKGYVSTFTKACLLYESGCTEFLMVMLDGTGGSIVGMGLFTPVSVCQGTEDVPSVGSFNTTVIIRSPIQAPVPDTATYIQKLEAMKSEKLEGRDNRSFLAKYWMYIVPVVLILLISGGGQDAAGGR